MLALRNSCTLLVLYGKTVQLSILKYWHTPYELETGGGVPAVPDAAVHAGLGRAAPPLSSVRLHRTDSDTRLAALPRTVSHLVLAVCPGRCLDWNWLKAANCGDSWTGFSFVAVHQRGAVRWPQPGAQPAQPHSPPRTVLFCCTVTQQHGRQRNSHISIRES